MKSLNSAFLILNAIATILTAQTAPDALSQSPPTMQMRVENLKIRHTGALAVAVGGIARIADDPTLLTAKETVDSIDRGSREMLRSCAACDAILSTLRAETATIHADSAFSDAQKDELISYAQALACECNAIHAEAIVTIKNLEAAYKELSRWKKIFRSYSNLHGEVYAKKMLNAAVTEYIKGLTAKPYAADSAPPAK